MIRSNRKGNPSIILSWVAIGISLVTMVLFFVKVTPNSVVNSDTFISTLAAFIGVSVTILVGYQVFNAVEIKQELSKINIIKEELENTKDELDTRKREVEKRQEAFQNEMEIIRCVCLSRVDIVDNLVTAFIRLHEALQYILSSDGLRENVVWYKEELSERMQRIDKSCLGLDVSGGIQSMRNVYLDDSKRVMAHENYFVIKDWYEEMMKRFEKVLDNIVKEELENSSEQFSSRRL